MKKLCLAVVLVFLGYVNSAKADRNGEFVRIECNKALGFFEIQEKSIFGGQADNFFNENDSYIKYSSDNGNFKTEVYWVNSRANKEKPFVCRCQISDALAYDIEIETMARGDCNYHANSLVNITEISRNPESGKDEEQKIVENLLIGCDGIVDQILWSHQYIHNASEKLYTILFKGNNFRVHMDEHTEKPITEKSIIEKQEEIKKYSEELRREEEEHKKEMEKLFGRAYEFNYY